MARLITPAILDDRPCVDRRQVQFQFEAYSNTLARLILSKNNKTPLVIGIYGEWGSGKTSLMQIVRAKVEEVRSARESGGLPTFMRGCGEDACRPCRTVWFNPWKYSRGEALWVSLIDEIRKEMAKDSGFFEGLRQHLKDPKRAKYKVPEMMANAATRFVTGGLVSLDPEKFREKSRFAENVAFYDEFQSFFDGIIADYTEREVDGALVVFIDDLDRCLPSKVVEVLEAVKLEWIPSIQKWLFGNLLRKASGEAYAELEVRKGERGEELVYRGTLIAQVKDGEAFNGHLASVLEKADKTSQWTMLRLGTEDLRERQPELRHIFAEMDSALDVLVLKRAFLGRCHLCPV